LVHNANYSKGMSSNIPDYIKDNRVPLDKETVLNSKEYQKTNIKVKVLKFTKKGINIITVILSIQEKRLI